MAAVENTARDSRESGIRGLDEIECDANVLYTKDPLFDPFFGSPLQLFF